MKQYDVSWKYRENERKELEKKWKKERTRGRNEENKSQMEKCEQDETFPERYMDVYIELSSTLYPS